MSETDDRPRMGRPPRVPLVDPTIADEICEWIAAGKTLRSYCRQPGKPKRSTVDEWRAKDDEFAGRVARARDIGFDEIAEDCLHIADTQEAGQTITDGDDGRKVVTEDMLGHRKLRVETRLKLLACWDPRRYGNKPTDDGVIVSAAKLLVDLAEIDRRNGVPSAP